MSVKDVRVRHIINDAIARASSDGDNCCGKIRRAWKMLKWWRDQPAAGGALPNSLDLDVDVVNWGNVGSREGEADRLRCNFISSPPLWRPVNEIMDLRHSGYLSVLGAPGTAYTPPK